MEKLSKSLALLQKCEQENHYIVVNDDLKKSYLTLRNQLIEIEKDNYLLAIYSLTCKVLSKISNLVKMNIDTSVSYLSLNTTIDTSFYPTEINLSFYIRGKSLNSEQKSDLLDSCKEERYNLSGINSDFVSDKFLNNLNPSFSLNEGSFKEEFLAFMLNEELTKRLNCAILDSELSYVDNKRTASKI